MLLNGEGKMENTQFYQLFEKLSSSPSHSFRQEFSGMLDGGQKRCFRLRFVGEGVSDNGGPYREIFGHMVEELQSPLLPLFTPCQNRVGRVGENRERWVIDPTAGAGGGELDLFAFFGQMVGVGHRGGVNLELLLGSYFWKALVSQPITPHDLLFVDEGAYNTHVRLEKMGGEEFESYGVVWDSSLSGSKLPVQVIVYSDFYYDHDFFVSFISLFFFSHLPSLSFNQDLRPNGRNVPVKAEEVKDFVKSSMEFRLSEANRQLESIRKGMGSVVPLDILVLFTWEEVFYFCLID